jgi:hypothetical protein
MKCQCDYCENPPIMIAWVIVNPKQAFQIAIPMRLCAEHAAEASIIESPIIERTPQNAKG